MILREVARHPAFKVWLEFGLLAVVICLPLLLPGYILSLDLVFTPHLPWPTTVTNTYPLDVMLWLFSRLITGEIVEKVILLGILLFSGVGMYQFIQGLHHSGSLQKTWRIAAYAAGIFYMINPFIYARIMAGQWMVLLGYALMPFFLTALVRFLVTPSRRTIVKLCVWTIAICVVSLHHIGMLAVLIIIFGLGYAVRNRRNKTILYDYAKWGSIGSLLVLAGNLYWLIPLFLQRNNISAATANFTSDHFQAFATVSGSFGAFGETLRLQGFWAEARQLFLLPQQIVPLWGIVVLVFWIILIVAVFKSWQKNRLLISIGLACSIVGVLLASTPFIEWISRSIPLFAGYREPHKLVNLVVLGYGILFAYGVATLLHSIRKNNVFRQGVVVGVMLLPIIITPTMFGGFAGQLTPRTYPPEWASMNDRLKQSKDVTTVLFLPWHQYAIYSFSERIIANPAEKFFEVPLLASNDPEFKNISATIPNKDKQTIGQALNDPSKLSYALQKAHVSHILLAKEQDWTKYLRVVTPNAQLITEDAKLQLYKVKGDYATK